MPTVHAALLDQTPKRVASGDLLGQRYCIGRLLGAGKVGSVYEARDEQDGRTVAVKVLRPDGRLTLTRLGRFYLEARAVAGIEHPNIVQTFDFGLDEGTRTPFLVMERGDGVTLSQIIAIEGSLPEPRAVHLLRQLAEALSAAHAAGLVHRDLKPENLLINHRAGREEHLQVFDFGVAKLMRPESSELQLTLPGAVIGTPLYMSPEQARGEDVDGRSDLYSLGCILHHVVSGRPPFEADEMFELLAMHDSTPPPPLRLPDGSPANRGLAALQARLLAKEPELRPNDAAEVANLLAAIDRGDDLATQATMFEARTTATRLAGRTAAKNALFAQTLAPDGTAEALEAEAATGGLTGFEDTKPSLPRVGTPLPLPPEPQIAPTAVMPPPVTTRVVLPPQSQPRLPAWVVGVAVVMLLGMAVGLGRLLTTPSNIDAVTAPRPDEPSIRAVATPGGRPAIPGPTGTRTAPVATKTSPVATKTATSIAPEPQPDTGELAAPVAKSPVKARRAKPKPERQPAEIPVW